MDTQTAPSEWAHRLATGCIRPCGWGCRFLFALPMEDKLKLITIKELAAMTRVTRKAVNDWIKKGEITYYRIGRRILFDPKEVLEAHKHTAIKTPPQRTVTCDNAR